MNYLLIELLILKIWLSFSQQYALNKLFIISKKLWPENSCLSVIVEVHWGNYVRKFLTV